MYWCEMLLTYVHAVVILDQKVNLHSMHIIECLNKWAQSQRSSLMHSSSKIITMIIMASACSKIKEGTVIVQEFSVMSACVTPN